MSFDTAAPADLLAHRDRVAALTGLAGSALGIIGNAAHTSGYHRSLYDLESLGRFHPDRGAGDSREDFSARLARDRLAWQLVDGRKYASAVDYGDDWPRGGRAAWLRFNNLLAGAFGLNDPLLEAVRAVNYSTRGTADTRFRLDREHGFRRETNTDTTTVHTHIEWYRDTTNGVRRAGSLARIEAIIWAAIGMEQADVSTLTDVQANQLHNAETMLGAMRDLTDPTLDPLDGHGDRVFPSEFARAIKGIAAGVNALGAHLPPQPTVDPVAFAQALTDDQCEAIGRGMGGAFFAAMLAAHGVASTG